MCVVGRMGSWYDMCVIKKFQEGENMIKGKFKKYFPELWALTFKAALLGDKNKFK